MENKQSGYRYSQDGLSAFCLQIAMLLKAAVPLDEGLELMAGDAADPEEKALLEKMADRAAFGEPFADILKETGVFPPYVERMALLGEQTGTMDQMMEELSEYYRKESRLMQAVKNAVTYPVMMVVLLLVVLFVLFTRVMPVFNGVYEQLGARMPAAALAAIRMGGLFSGAALAVVLVIALLLLAFRLSAGLGRRWAVMDRLLQGIKSRSRIAAAIANRRFTSVLALTLKSGMELEKGMSLAGELVDHAQVAEKIGQCRERLETGAGYYEAMKETGLFSGFYVQMIKVGVRSGRLDQVMEEISGDYEEMADGAINRLIARFEPAIVAVLAVAVGLVLLSVMLPLAGILSSVG